MNERHPIGRSFAPGRGLGNGLTAIRVALGPLWLGGLLMAVSDQGCNGPGGIPDIPLKDDEDVGLWHLLSPQAWDFAAAGLAFDPSDFIGWIVALVAAIAFVALAVGIALFALKCWAHTGFIRLQVNVLEHANDAIAPLFSGKDRFWAMAGWKMISGLSMSAAFLVAAWPGALVAYVGYQQGGTTAVIGGVGFALLFGLPALVFVALGVYLGDCAVVLENASPVTALRRAWTLARGNRFALLWFAFVCMLVEIASVFGIVLCCVGLLATVPLALALTGFAKTESFLLFTRGHDASDGWRLWNRHLGTPPATGGAAPAASPASSRGWQAEPPRGSGPAAPHVPPGWQPTTPMSTPADAPDVGTAPSEAASNEDGSDDPERD